MKRFLMAASAAFLLSACASYQTQVEDARRDFVSDPESAVKRLEPLANKENGDQLVYMLDYATALQVAGRYSDSSKAFLKAEKIADLADYHSVSKVAASLALNEEMVQYKGDDFEKVLINGMNAINFLEMGDFEGAMVEVKRVNEKLYKLKFDGKKDFNQSPFAFYLGALIYEADKKYDDAYIAYKNAYDVAPNYPPLREDLIRSAIRAQRPEEVEKWKKQFPEVPIRPEWKDRTRGEIIFVLQNGWGPRKYPRPESRTFPKLVAVSSSASGAQVVATTLPSKEALANPKSKPPAIDIVSQGTQSIYSIQDIAIKALDDDFGRLVASRIAGVATKAVLADQIRQKDQALGQVAMLAMMIADRADLRQWSTLPATFQIARLSVKPGTYQIDAQGMSGAFPTGVKMAPRQVVVRPGQKAFVSWRQF